MYLQKGEEYLSTVQPRRYQGAAACKKSFSHGKKGSKDGSHEQRLGWNFRTIYGCYEPSRNRVVEPARQAILAGGFKKFKNTVSVQPFKHSWASVSRPLPLASAFQHLVSQSDTGALVLD
jgi:hypothetical protein